MRERLLRPGVQWRVCRTARAAMWAPGTSGVRFRVIVHDDGTIERWRQPKLAPWEVPRRNPAEQRPQHPEVAAQRRAAQRQWRARRRWQEAAMAAARGDAELPSHYRLVSGSGTIF